MADVPILKNYTNGEWVESSSTDIRDVRNPATGEAIKIKAKTVVKFRVAKACKDTIIPPK